MAYACPVCDAPQADGEHLANHLAFSALLGRADHEDWLDEHAPGWEADRPEELADRVVPHAEAVEYPDLELADAADAPDLEPGDGPGAGDRVPGGPGPRASGSIGAGVTERLSPEARRILEEARELTRRRADDAEPDGDGKG